MSKFYQKILRWFIKPHKFTKLIDNKYRIEEAFEYEGVKYYHFSDQFEVPAGRQFMALGYYEELQMRVDREYLEKHVAAMKKLFSDPKKISIQDMLKLNMFLEERLSLMPMPDYLFRLGSVMYFDDTESPFAYDYEYNQKKIAHWKKGGDVLSFFLQTPLKDLIPSLGYAQGSSQMYFPVLAQIEKIHQDHLSGVLSAKQ